MPNNGERGLNVLEKVWTYKKIARQTLMELGIKIAAFGVITAIVGGAVYLIAARGPAIILDMAAGAAAFICL